MSKQSRYKKHLNQIYSGQLAQSKAERKAWAAAKIEREQKTDKLATRSKSASVAMVPSDKPLSVRFAHLFDLIMGRGLSFDKALRMIHSFWRKNFAHNSQ